MFIEAKAALLGLSGAGTVLGACSTYQMYKIDPRESRRFMPKAAAIFTATVVVGLLGGTVLKPQQVIIVEVPAEAQPQPLEAKLLPPLPALAKFNHS